MGWSPKLEMQDSLYQTQYLRINDRDKTTNPYGGSISDIFSFREKVAQEQTNHTIAPVFVWRVVGAGLTTLSERSRVFVVSM